MEDVEAEEGPPEEESNEPPFPPIYESGEDYDKATEFKQEAADLKSDGNLEGALEKYSAAVQAAPPSALLYANRAMILLKLGRPRAAERDCDLALKENPDSAKALRVRGKARKELHKYEGALKDLSAAQQIDFDEDTVEDLKFLTEKHLEIEKEEADKRNKEEEKLRKRAEEIKKAQEEAKAESEPKTNSSSAASGDMPGMEGLAQMLMTDPEIIEAMQNPKVQAALQSLMSGPGGPMGLMSNPAKLQEVMSDPDVRPVFEKIMAKLGMGAGGVPNFGEGGAGGTTGDENMPDLDDIPDL